jgi:glycosyltransferase involved in cell wall biosynthesis
MVKEISIVVCFHNEEEALKDLMPCLLRVTKNVGKKFEIIMVDDASIDGGAEVVKSLQREHSEIRLLQLPHRGGQSGCFEEAFKVAKGEYIIRMDGDLQDDPHDLPKFLTKMDQGSELVMGLRECRKHPKALRLAAGVYDLLILLLFDSPLHSNSGSYVAFKGELMKNIPFRKNDHRYLPLIALRRGAKDIGEVIVRHNQRRYGSSKYSVFRKVFFGIPELFAFLIRLKAGVYDFKQNQK